MVEWHYRLNAHEPERTPGDSGGQGSLACYNPWGQEESDMTERLNNTGLCIKMRGKKNAKGLSGTPAHKEEVLSQTIKFHTRSLARVRNLLSSAHLPHA